MGESSHAWSKKQKVSATQITRTNAVCEDCGRKWTATLAEVPVTLFIKNLDEYYEKLSNNLLGAVDPPMVLCVFHPSDRHISDTEVTLSCVAPLQDSPYHWCINHRHNGPAADSGCQIFPWRDKILESKIEDSTSTEQDIVTIKEEIKFEEVEEDEEIIEEMGLDPLADVKDVKPEVDNTTVSLSSGPRCCRSIHQYNSSTNIIPSTNITPELPSNRFVSLTQQDLDDLSAYRHKKNTTTATRFGCKAFRDWLEARDQSPEFEGLEKIELASLLQRFYGEVRKQDGSRYSKQSMISIRAAINRQLHCQKWERNFDIIGDSEFSRANRVLEGIFKDLSAKGLDIPKSHCPLEPGDFKKLIETGTIGLDNPVSLQNLTWLNICLQFGKRGLEGWRDMKKDTFIEGIDDQGKKYFCFNENQQKNKYLCGNIATSHRSDARVYEQDGIELCPVKAIKLYLSYLSSHIDDLWQKPNQLYNKTGVWYASQPLGKNTLSKIMRRMSEMARLSVQHTNHCVRATSCTIMAEAGIQDRDIVKVTGHRDVKSLKRYIDRAPSSTKRLHSGILASAMVGNTLSSKEVNTPVQEADTSAQEKCTPTQETHTPATGTSEPHLVHQDIIYQNTSPKYMESNFL